MGGACVWMAGLAFGWGLVWAGLCVDGRGWRVSCRPLTQGVSCSSEQSDQVAAETGQVLAHPYTLARCILRSLTRWEARCLGRNGLREAARTRLSFAPLLCLIRWRHIFTHPAGPAAGQEPLSALSPPLKPPCVILSPGDV